MGYLTKKKVNYIVWAAGFCVLSLFMFFPILIMFLTSVKSDGDLLRFWPGVMKWSNYAEVWSQGQWPLYFRNSLIISGIAVVVSLFLNSMAGFAFARLKFRGKKVIFILIILGMIMPSQVTLLPVFLAIVRFPMAGGNNIWGQGGMGLYNTYLGILLPMISGSFGVFFCRQFFITFPRALDEAARIDGASTWQIYWKIYLPNAKPLLATLGLLKFATSWNDYLWPLVMVSSENMKTVQLALTRFQQESDVQWNLLMAATMMVSIPVLLLFLFAQKYFIEGTVTSGLK